MGKLQLRNEAAPMMMLDDSAPKLSRGAWLALTAALLGWMLDGAEMGAFSLVGRPAILDLLGSELAASGPERDREVGRWLGVITGLFLVGAATGGVLFGWLADRIGRVRAMTISVLTYAVFTSLCGVVTKPIQLGALRFIASLGMGGEWSLGVALVMEVFRTCYEGVAEMNADAELKARLERLRIACGHAMGLGDVTNKNYPKMTLVAPPRHGGSLCTRSFIPHVCHDAIGVLAAVTVGTACVLHASVCAGTATVPPGDVKKVSVEHPTGEFSVELGVDPAHPQNVTRAALLRTARLIMRGEVMIPASIWKGKRS